MQKYNLLGGETQYVMKNDDEKRVAVLKNNKEFIEGGYDPETGEVTNEKGEIIPDDDIFEIMLLTTLSGAEVLTKGIQEKNGVKIGFTVAE